MSGHSVGRLLGIDGARVDGTYSLDHSDAPEAVPFPQHRAIQDRSANLSFWPIRVVHGVDRDSPLRVLSCRKQNQARRPLLAAM